MNTFAIAALTALLFLGGWYGPWLPAWLWFLMKCYFVILIIFWIRGTFPRLRIDQLMAFAWQVVVPLSFLNIVITGIYMFYGWPWWSLSLMSLSLLSLIGYLIYRHMAAPAKKVAEMYKRRQAGAMGPGLAPRGG